MKYLFLITSLFIVITATSQSFYDFKVETLEGEIFDFATLKGKTVMIVNTASKCGLTPQYEKLEKLYKEYGGDNFIIIGFPANDFLEQEPLSNTEIKEFCTKNYGVSFPMMAKITVTGDNIHPVYKWLTKKKLNGYKNSKVKWNFQKYIINKEGKLIGIFQPKTDPLSPEIIDLIKKNK